MTLAAMHVPPLLSSQVADVRSVSAEGPTLETIGTGHP